MRSEPELVSELLQEYGSITQQAVARYLPEPSAADYLSELVSDYPGRGGKMMRPSLCLATARAFGARPEDALASAVSIELLHNSLLIHDDIEDESEERRGRPTLHQIHGIPLAINAGAMLGLLSFEPLWENLDRLGSNLAAEIVLEAYLTAWKTGEGQALELGWRRDNRLDLRPRDYFCMVLKKTCWLGMIYPTRVGALIGSGGSVPLDQFMRFGSLFGTAFQIQDDVLNLLAEESYGKERDGDIWEGKRTLMLCHVYKAASEPERARIARALEASRDRRDADDVRWIRETMDRYGSIEYALTIARGLAGAALHEFDLSYEGLADSRDKRFIKALVTWVIERTS